MSYRVGVVVFSLFLVGCGSKASLPPIGGGVLVDDTATPTGDDGDANDDDVGDSDEDADADGDDDVDADAICGNIDACSS